MSSRRRKPPVSTATDSTYEFRTRLWRWSGGKASWYFLTLPAALGREIRLVDAGPRRSGFGSLRVQATIGECTWQTSIFPSTQHGSYLLPVKSSVRKAASLAEGKTVNVRVVVRRA
jgi:hypothetical protein